MSGTVKMASTWRKIKRGDRVRLKQWDVFGHVVWVRNSRVLIRTDAGDLQNRLKASVEVISEQLELEL
jgi:hypothetical protein